MKESSPEKQERAYGPHERGPAVQVQFSAVELGLSLATNAVPHGSALTGKVMISNGYPIFSLAITSSQNGSATLQRYIDQAGAIPIGSLITQALTGTTAAVLALTNDGVPFQSFKIVVNNSAGSDGTLTNVMGLLQSH